MAESYSVTAILSAQDKNFSSVFGSAQGAADSLAGKLKSGLGFGVMQAVGMRAVSAVTGAISGMAGGIVDAGMTFDASMSQVAATMGKSVSDIEDLRDFAQQMGATTAFSATEAAEALNYMALAGYKTDESMAMLPNVLNLAAAGSIDLARASDMVTDTQTAFGLKMEEMPQLIDEMAKAASTGNTSVEQLGDAFLTVGGLAQELNGGFVTLADGTKSPVSGVQELEIALTAMANAGVKGSEAGTHMRNMLLKLSSPTSEGVAALKEMGVSVFDLEGNMRSLSDIFGDLNDSMSGMTQEQKIQTIADLFNTRDLSSAEALLNAVGEDWDKIGASILDADGAAEQMANTQLDNLSGDVTLFQSALEGLRISIFDNFNGPMRAAVKIATEGLTELKGVVDNLGDAFGGAFNLSEISDALETGGLTGALDVVMGSLDKLPEGFKAAAAAAGGLAGVSLVNGFLDSGIWKTGVAGVGTFKDAIKTLPGAIGKDAGVITGKISDIGSGLMNIASKTVPDLLTNMDAAGEAAKKVGGKVSGMFGKAQEATVGRFAKAFPNLTSAMRTTTREAGRAASGIVGTFGKMGSALTKTMGFALKAIMPAAAIGAVLAGLGLLYSQFGDQIDGILKMAQQKGPQFITNLVSGITSRLPALIASGAQLVSGLLTTITANLPALIQGGVDLISSLVMGVSASASMLMTKGIELIGTLVVSIASAIPQLITTGMTLLASLAQGVANNLPLLASYAMNAVMTFAQGIIGNLPQILSAAVSIVSSLVIGIVNMLPVLIQQGIQLVTYLAQSFIENLPMIIQTGITIIAALVNGLIQAVPMIIEGAIELVKSLIDTIINTDWIKVGGDIINAIGNGIKNGFGGLGSLVFDLFSGDTSAIEGGAQQGAAAAESTAQAYLDSSSYVADAASQVGTGATEGLISGISEGSAQVTDMLGTMATEGAEAFQTPLSEIDISGIMQSVGAEGVSTFTGAVSAIDLSGIGTEVSGTLATEFDAGMAQMPQIASSTGEQVVSALQQAGTQAVDAVKTMTNNLLGVLRSCVGPATMAGKTIGSQFATGLRNTSGTVQSAASSLKNAALNNLSGGYGRAYSYGANIGQGLADGMWSKVGSAWAAAESLAAAADKAIHARAQIGSPSRITTRYGRFIGEGLAKGMESESGDVSDQADSLAGNMIESIENKIRAARTAMTNLVDAASPEAIMSRRTNDLSLNDEYEYKSEAHYNITVQSVLDGKKVGEGCAEFVGKAIDKKQERDARKRGVRA